MSVDTATPAGSAGSAGGDRYRLIECVAGDPDGSAVAWRAWDNLLARPVTLTVVRPGGSAAAGFLTHAHAISTTVHPALARVYDAVDDGSRAYVVSEWVTGTPLTALLQEGALDADTAAGMVGRVAGGVAAAHDAGVAFGGVHPDHVVVTPGGTVTLAQVVGDGRAAPADDVRGLGALLYAALTARWPLAPTGGAAALRPASANGGHLLTPRQVRAGVPEDLSTLAMRALDPGAPHGVRSAAGMASVLADRAAPAEDMFPFDTHERPPRQRPRWVAVAVPVAAAFAVLALVGWLVGSALGRVPGSHRASSPGPTAAAGPTSAGARSATSAPSGAPRPVGIASATLYDPSPNGDGAEAKRITQSYDDNPLTAWPTDQYKRNPNFGNLKRGLGIAYDLGRPMAVREVEILTDKPGMDLQVLAGDSPSAADPSSYRVAATVTDLGRSQKITLQPGPPAQYYIVWVTRLVSTGTDTYDASLSEVHFLQ